MKRLLLVVLTIGFIGFIGVASGCATRQAPKSEAERRVVPGPATVNPHLDVPRNCQQTRNADGSVLMTCECENCGHPEARDGLPPAPWPCVLRDQGLFCGYGNSVNVSKGRDVTALEFPLSGACGRGRAPCYPAASTAGAYSRIGG